MADASIEFLLNNFRDLLVSHSDLINDTGGKIENLARDLQLLKAYMRDIAKRRKKEATMKEIARVVQDVIYEVEDIIDAFVTNAVVEKSPNSSSSRLRKNPVDLNTIGKKVEGIIQKVRRRCSDFAILSLDEDRHEKPEPRPPRKKNVVGFADATEDLIWRLTRETDYFDVVSLVGMFGLGKTTLAWKIFNDPQIACNFPTRIWLPISQEFSTKDIFLCILNEVTSINDDTRTKTEHELADLVAAHLMKIGSFLIVMDDVWRAEDWDRLREALPRDNTKGKVLITSRNDDVGYASQRRPPYNLRLFTFEESWELFRLEAFGKLDCPSELEVVGQKIAKDCEGLPLAIVAIGRILAAKFSGSVTSAMRRYWELVSKHVSSYLCESDPANRTQKSISLSYDKLPYHLRACFLYFGLFPKDYEIPVSKLIRMWIGEGFVEQDHDCSLEVTAQKYLNDLIKRNLVNWEKLKPDGTVKTCRCADVLRVFCLIEATNEHFLQEIKYQSNGQFTPSSSNIDKCHRLSLHSNCLDFISSRPFGPRVRSFVCLSNDTYVVSPENNTKFIGAFKVLRVLDVSPFRFTKIASNMYNLYHLRYIALSSDLSVLPSKFYLLWNIQTLIVDTTSRTLKVEVDIWKMNYLRHFKTNASATLPKSTKSGKQCTKLQTLGLISIESCTEELSDRAPNLKKLGIRGQLGLLFDKRNSSFDRLREMRELGKLELINDPYLNPWREGGLGCLPEPHRFPPGLRSLTLCATSLSWEYMSTLGLLDKLEVLKLKNNAFSGSIWVAVDGGFRCLEALHIENADLVDWNASSHHYPKLRILVLKNCVKLRGIPAALADIQSLEKLELNNCIAAAESAKGISDAKKKTQVEGSAFMLSIYPPVE